MRIAYCMMCQNSLIEVAERIKEMQPHVDRICVVDGGSVDDSIYYLRNHEGVEFKLKQWANHFSNQRNEYINMALNESGGTDWIIVSDPDESFNQHFRDNIRGYIAQAEAQNKNMITVRCQSRSWKGDKLVWENLDNYRKGLIFKAVPGIRYTGNPHEYLNTPGGQKVFALPDDAIYFHDKQENVIWKRGARNMIIGGGGPNLGHAAPLWRELHDVLDVIGWPRGWHEVHDRLIVGGVPQPLKDYMINRCRVQTGYDGASEYRELYKYYFRVLHPEEEPGEYAGQHIE